jgi:hypothetical protein
MYAINALVVQLLDVNAELNNMFEVDVPPTTIFPFESTSIEFIYTGLVVSPIKYGIDVYVLEQKDNVESNIRSVMYNKSCL